MERVTAYVDAYVIRITTLRSMGISLLRPAVKCMEKKLCGFVDFSEQERTTVLNCLASMILSQYTTVNNQC